MALMKKCDKCDRYCDYRYLTAIIDEGEKLIDICERCLKERGIDV